MDRYEYERKKTRRIVLGLIWISAVGTVVFKLDGISAAAVLNLSTEDRICSVVALIGFFVLKGVTQIIHGGTLFFLSGLLLPFPIAFILCLVGMIIMFLLPYNKGRGQSDHDQAPIKEKYPQLKNFASLGVNEQVASIAMMRFDLSLPLEPISTYLGAGDTELKVYLFGSLLGILPAMTAYVSIGSCIVYPNQPLLIIAVYCVILRITYYIAQVIRHKKDGTAPVPSSDADQAAEENDFQ